MSCLFFVCVALLEKYVSLKNQAEGIQTELKLKKEMAQLKDDIIALAENVLSSGTDNVDRNELEKYINQMKVRTPVFL